MFTAYIVVTLLAAAANIFSATLDFIRFKPILINMARVSVSESWITTLGTLKAAGALGLLVGIAMPLIGVAAAGRPCLDHCGCHRHAPASSRLLVRSGGRVPHVGRDRAYIKARCVVKEGPAFFKSRRGKERTDAHA